MVFKYLVAIGLIGAVSMAVAAPQEVPVPAALTSEAIKEETPIAASVPAPMPEPTKTEKLPPMPVPVKEVESNPVKYAILNALEKQKHSTRVDEEITITLQDGQYKVTVKMIPRGGNTGFLTLEEFLNVVFEGELRNAETKGEHTFFAYKKGKKMGITDLTPGSTGQGYHISRLSLGFNKIS